MLVRLAKAKTSIQIFFPVEPIPQSPYANAGRHWQTSSGQPDIQLELETLLRHDELVVSGYSIGRGAGMWFNQESTQWEADEICEILAYVGPDFAQELRGPDMRSAPRQYLARIGRLSCLEMGHACCWCIVNGNQVEEISREGMQVGERYVSFDDILS